jgi:hypothetical protein
MGELPGVAEVRDDLAELGGDLLRTGDVAEAGVGRGGLPVPTPGSSPPARCRTRRSTSAPTARMTTMRATAAAGGIPAPCSTVTATSAASAASTRVEA